VVNNEERRIRQGGTLGKGVFFCLGVIFFIRRGRKEKGGGQFGDYVFCNFLCLQT
jgi:hypothetical protein